jgi:hypothetical protein
VVLTPDGVGVSCFSHVFAVEYRQTLSKGRNGIFPDDWDSILSLRLGERKLKQLSRYIKGVVFYSKSDLSTTLHCIDYSGYTLFP